MTELARKSALAEGEIAAPKSPLSRLLFSLAVLALLSALCAPLFVNDLKAPGAPTATNGVIDYARWGPLNKPVELAGEWRMTWYGGGKDQGPKTGTELPVKLPGLWTRTELAGGGHLPGNGLAAYRLTLQGLRPGRYTLYIPTMWAANQVWANDVLISQRGEVGRSPETTRYKVRSHELPIELTGTSLNLVIEEAAFQHRDNGIDSAPVLGLTEPMHDWIALEWAHAFLFVTALILLAAYGLVVFFFRPRDRASLYFALSCLAFLPTAAVFRYDNLLLIALPNLSLGGVMAIMYLTGILSISCFLAYVHALFPSESPRRVFVGILALYAVLAVTQAILLALGDTFTSSWLHQFVLAYIGLTLLYILGIVIYACVHARDGAVAFLAGISIFFTTFMIGSFVSIGWLERDRIVGIDYQSIGVLMLLFSHIVILAERWSMAMQATEQTNDDLRRLLDVNTAITTEMQLEALLQRIVSATTKIVHADRSSLFLHDDRTDELWSLVAEGLSKKVIRFPANFGLAGHSFTNREVVNVKDAYRDSRFYQELDPVTGYKTKSILTVPVTTRDGRRLGIMQALNSTSADGFSNDDIARMTAFAAQAAVAIDNATLFTDVVAERNYNESILRSMSSGVITLDTLGRVVKMNAAASALFAVPIEEVLGQNARDLLASRNAWLIGELDAVNKSGDPKSLLDVDFNTRHGTLSVNISIVPLRGGGDMNGLLVLMEDISEGKRLQGAMRRFMTQKVVDQVMAQEDDLLFGTACDASVLFADIRNFTSIAETLDPRETVDMLNEIFTELFEAVADFDGVLDKFIGDAIMAVYGAPISSGRDPQNAVASAMTMLRMMEEINLRRSDRDLPELGLGIGISTGEVVAGTIGSPKRMDYTVIGDSVNLAARLQAITKLYKVETIVCERTAAIIDGNVLMRELDLIRVRGRKQPEKIFHVLPKQGGREGEALFAAYQQGRAFLAERDWQQAAAAFEAALALDPDDHPSALMLQRCRILARKAPEQDWDGVWEAIEAA